MDARIEDLRTALDVLAEFYADRLADGLDRMPADGAVLGLFCDLIRATGVHVWRRAVRALAFD